MTSCLCDLFWNLEKRNRPAIGLLTAFDMVRQRMPKANFAVGILREHVIIGFSAGEFGKDNMNALERRYRRRFNDVPCGGIART